jgi:hypothetical protein
MTKCHALFLVFSANFMDPIQTWGEAISSSLIDMWVRFINYMPTILGAIVVFMLGVIVASLFGKITERIVKATHIDQAIDRISVGEKLKEHGIDMAFSHFCGKLVQWFLVLVFLMAATNILRLKQVAGFLNRIILYLPNIIVATIILSIAFLLGNFVYIIVRSSTRAAGITSATLLAKMIKWSIIIFGLLAALIQLGVATTLVNTIFIGLVAASSLAVGLAFGLGGRDEAALILKKIRKEITEKK